AEVYLGDKLGPKADRAPSPAPPPKPEASGVDYSQLAGDYYSQDVDVTYHVVWAGGKLTYVARGIPQQQLVPMGNDVFRADPLTFRFERSSPNGVATGFKID